MCAFKPTGIGATFAPSTGATFVPTKTGHIPCKKAPVPPSPQSPFIKRFQTIISASPAQRAGGTTERYHSSSAVLSLNATGHWDNVDNGSNGPASARTMHRAPGTSRPTPTQPHSAWTDTSGTSLGSRITNRRHPSGHATGTETPRRYVSTPGKDTRRPFCNDKKLQSNKRISVQTEINTVFLGPYQDPPSIQLDPRSVKPRNGTDHGNSWKGTCSPANRAHSKEAHSCWHEIELMSGEPNPDEPARPNTHHTKNYIATERFSPQPDTSKFTGGVFHLSVHNDKDRHVQMSQRWR